MSNGDSPKIERGPQTWRVRTLEGMTCRQFSGLFVHREDSVVRELCQIAAWRGDRSKLDSFYEVGAVAQLFAGPNGPYRGLLSWSISDFHLTHLPPSA